MNLIYRLEETVLGPLSRALNAGLLSFLMRLTFLAVLALFFWNSALGKLGEGISGLWTPSVGAYASIMPKAMEAVGYDPSQLGLGAKLFVLAGTWGEFLIPALVVAGLFTRASAFAMIVFIIVLSYVDVTGHGVGVETLGGFFDRVPDAKILDQRSLWVAMLLVLVAKGGGWLSLDTLIGRDRDEPTN